MMSSEVGEHPVLWRVHKVMNLFEKKKQGYIVWWSSMVLKVFLKSFGQNFYKGIGYVKNRTPVCF